MPGRNQRVCISVDVTVLWRPPGDKLGSEETKTLVVKAQGALVPLRRVAQINELVTLRNVTTREEVDCRVVDLSSVDQPGMTGVTLEFIKPAPRFWRIAFPPASWTTRSPEARTYIPHITVRPKPYRVL
jgi:hypothetical protein